MKRTILAVLILAGVATRIGIAVEPPDNPIPIDVPFNVTKPDSFHAFVADELKTLRSAESDVQREFQKTLATIRQEAETRLDAVKHSKIVLRPKSESGLSPDLGTLTFRTLREKSDEIKGCNADLAFLDALDGLFAKRAYDEIVAKIRDLSWYDVSPTNGNLVFISSPKSSLDTLRSLQRGQRLISQGDEATIIYYLRNFGEADTLTLGEYGGLSRYRVLQVIDGSNLLVTFDHRTDFRRTPIFWITGINTKGLVDRALLDNPACFTVKGTKTYTNTTGVGSTVYVLEPFDLTAAIRESRAKGNFKE